MSAVATPSGAVAVAAPVAASIVLITHDRAALLPRCVRSLWAQGHRPLQIVVVDDGSTDDTAVVLADLARACPADVAFVVCAHATNRGIGAARNTGIAAANGRYIAFTDDDCVARPDWLQHLLAPFTREAGLAIVGGGIDEPADRTWAQRASEGINWLGTRERRVRAIVGCNMAFEASFLRENPFDAGARAYADEQDRCLAAHAAGRGVWFTPAARVTHHHRQSVPAFLRQQRRRGAGAVWVRHKHGLGLWPRKYWVVALLFLSTLTPLCLPAGTAVSVMLACAALFVLQTVLLDRAREKRLGDVVMTLPLVLLGYVFEFLGAVVALARGRRQ